MSLLAIIGAIIPKLGSYYLTPAIIPKLGGYYRSYYPETAIIGAIITLGVTAHCDTVQRTIYGIY